MDSKILSIDNYILESGIEMPVIGFGTGVIKRFYLNTPMYIKDKTLSILRSVKHMKLNRTLKNDYTIGKTLKQAIKSGYTLFDSGRSYGHSERCIGKAIAKHNRSDFFITTKVCGDDLRRYSYAQTVNENLAISLRNLNTSYVDAYLLHYPEPDMISLYKEIEREFIWGGAKSIGVCNFDVDELEVLMKNCDINPMINQVELHPLNQKPELRQFCHDNHIILMAHTPTASGYIKEFASSEIMRHLSNKYHKSVVQIIYRWHIQNGVVPIVSTTSKEHLESDIDIFDFHLSEDEMKSIGELNQDRVLCKYNSKQSDVPEYIYNA